MRHALRVTELETTLLPLLSPGFELSSVTCVPPTKFLGRRVPEIRADKLTGRRCHLDMSQQLKPLDVSPNVESFFLEVYSEMHWDKLRLALAVPPTTTYFRVIVLPTYQPDVDFRSAALQRRSQASLKLQSAVDKVILHRLNISRN